MRDFLKYLTQLNLPLAITLLAGSVALWIPDVIAAVGKAETDYTLISLPHAITVSTYPIVILLFTFVVTVINSVVIMGVLYNSGLTKSRSLMPVVLYMMLVGSVSFMHFELAYQIGLLLFCIVLLILYAANRRAGASEEVFLATLLLLVGAAFIPDLVWFVIFIWVALIVERSFNLRTWLASVIACVIVAIATLIIEYSVGNGFEQTGFYDVFFRQLHAVDNRRTLVIEVFYSILMIALTVYYYSTRSRLNVRLIVACDLFLLAALFVLVLIIFPSAQGVSLYQIGALSVTALAVHYFSGQPSILRGSLFIANIVIQVLYWL